jgi:hypothetical protein
MHTDMTSKEPLHIILYLKRQEYRTKKEYLKDAREKCKVSLKVKLITITAYFSKEIL